MVKQNVLVYVILGQTEKKLIVKAGDKETNSTLSKVYSYHKTHRLGCPSTWLKGCKPQSKYLQWAQNPTSRPCPLIPVRQTTCNKVNIIKMSLSLTQQTQSIRWVTTGFISLPTSLLCRSLLKHWFKLLGENKTLKSVQLQPTFNCLSAFHQVSHDLSGCTAEIRAVGQLGRWKLGGTYLTWLSQNLVFCGELSSTVRAVASTGSAWEVVPDISSSAFR